MSVMLYLHKFSKYLLTLTNFVHVDFATPCIFWAHKIFKNFFPITSAFCCVLLIDINKIFSLQSAWDTEFFFILIVKNPKRQCYQTEHLICALVHLSLLSIKS